MKININKFIPITAMLLAVMVSCSEDYSDTNSVKQSFEAFPFTSNISPIGEVEEIDASYDFTFELDDRQIAPVTIEVEAGEESTATEGEDFLISKHSLPLDAFSGGGSFSVLVGQDYETEGDETIYLKTYGSPFGQPEEFETLAITIKDSIYNPGVVLDWTGEFPFGGATYNWCGNIDIDLYVLDAGGNEVSGYAGATGACPEEVLHFADLADGDYSLYANLYEGLAGYGITEEIPLAVSLIYLQDDIALPGESTIGFNSFDYPGIVEFTGDTPDDPNGDNLIYLGAIRVSDSGKNWSLIDPDGVNLGTLSVVEPI